MRVLLLLLVLTACGYYGPPERAPVPAPPPAPAPMDEPAEEDEPEEA